LVLVGEAFLLAVLRLLVDLHLQAVPNLGNLLLGSLLLVAPFLVG
jgi:hypothetical protein